MTGEDRTVHAWEGSIRMKWSSVASRFNGNTLIVPFFSYSARARDRERLGPVQERKPGSSWLPPVLWPMDTHDAWQIAPRTPLAVPLM